MSHFKTFIAISFFCFYAATATQTQGQIQTAPGMRHDDLVRQALELAAQASSSPNATPRAPNPFQSNRNTGTTTGLQPPHPLGPNTGRPAIGVTDSAFRIQVNGHDILVPRVSETVHNRVTNTETLSPTAGYIEFARGIQALSQSNYPAAIIHLENYVQANPQDPMAHPYLSLAFFAQGNYDRAAEYAYSTAATNEPWNWTQLQALYSDVNHYAAQYEQLQMAARRQDATSSTKFLVGWHHIMLGHRAAAAAEFQIVLNEIPNDPVVGKLLALANQPAILPPEPLK